MAVPDVEYAVFQPATLVADRFRRPYIYSGYRRESTWAQCAASVCRLHNETLNIWSHLAGLAVFLAIHHNFEQSVFTATSAPLDRLVCTLFFVSCELTFALSALYHIGAAHVSERLVARLLKLDLAGICLMIGGSFVPGLYFGFYCAPGPQFAYCVANSAMISVGIILAAVDLEHRPRLYQARQLFYVGIVATAVVPIVHWVAISPLAVVERFVWRLLLMLFVYAVAFGVFRAHVPERWRPGRFDVLGHSHQIWHVLVVTAALIWYWELHDYYSWLQANGCALYRA